MSWVTEQTLISSRYDNNAPVPSARRAWDFFNLPHGAYGGPFEPPAVDPDSPDDSIWQRLTIEPVPRSARPFHLGADAIKYREGLIFIQTFGPKLSAGLTILQTAQAAGEIYHRAQFGIIRCRDMDTPKWVSPPRAAWHQINVVIPYLVLDATETWVEDGWVQ